MALVSVPMFCYPKPVFEHLSNGGSAPSAFLLDAAGEQVAFIFMAPDTATLDHVGFKVETVTTTGTVKCSIQTVTAAGEPGGVGTQIGSFSETLTLDTSQVFKMSSSTNMGASLTAGVMYALIIEWVSGGPFNIGYYNTSSASHPFVQHYTGTWSKVNNGVPLMLLEYSTGSYAKVPGALITANNAGTRDFSNASNPDEYGNRFVIPIPTRIVAVAGYYRFQGDTTIQVFEGSSTTPTLITDGTITVDKDQLSANSSQLHFSFPLKTGKTVAAGNVISVTFRPDSTDQGRVAFYTFNSVAHREVYHAGVTMITDNNGSGTKTETTTSVLPELWLVCDQLDDGVGSFSDHQLYT